MKPKLMQDMMPGDLKIPVDALAIWVIYDHPDDYPDHFVLRPQFAVRSGDVVIHPLAWTSAEIEPLREVMREMGKVQMARHADDDPKIVETWI